MWMFIAGASFGCVMGFLMFALLNANKGSDCINCDVLINRDQAIDAQAQDIRKLTRQRDYWQDRAEQEEEKVHGLRTKIGMRGAELQRVAFFHQKEA